NGYSFALIGHWAQLGSPPRAGTSIAEFLLSRTQRKSDQGEAFSVLAAIDQFEMLFTSFPARQAERDAFIDELSAALRQLPALKLLLVIADDHLATLRSYEHRFAPDTFNYVRLEALRVGSAIEALTRPLAGMGKDFAPGVAEELIDQL